MTYFGVMAGLAIGWAWGWPESVGKWAAEAVASYRKHIKQERKP